MCVRKAYQGILGARFISPQHQKQRCGGAALTDLRRGQEPRPQAAPGCGAREASRHEEQDTPGSSDQGFLASAVNPGTTEGAALPCCFS